MFQKKDFGNVELARCIDADGYSADANGESIDRRGFDGLMLVASIGDTASNLSAANRFRLIVQDSDDGSTWADVDDGDIVGDDVTGGHFFAIIDTDTTDEDIVRSCAYVGGKRYVRVRADRTGTVNGLGISVVGVLTREIYS